MGRPTTLKHKRQVIILDASDDEAARIKEAIPDTRQRTELFLIAIDAMETCATCGYKIKRFGAFWRHTEGCGTDDAGYFNSDGFWEICGNPQPKQLFKQEQPDNGNQNS